jgi:GntR family transcriptional regulator
MPSVWRNGDFMLDRMSRKPLYVQLDEITREKLSSGEWMPGAPIPSENVLSHIYGISRMTVRNVITKLVQEGLFERIPGKGTYVKENKIFALPISYGGVREQLERMGYEVTTKLIFIEKNKVTKDITDIFGLEPDTMFYVLQRQRYVKGIPLSIHTSYVPADLSPGLENKDLENEQLCVILNKSYGLKQAKMNETLESVAANKNEAKLLQVKTGHPLLLLEDSIMTEYSMVFEYSKVVFRGDKYKINLVNK